MTRLTVAICTRNRAAALGQTLAALAAALPPRHAALEVLLVLNDCSDESPAVAAAWRSRLPLTVIEEPVAGHSHARNRAIAAATGDVILWTDDDVTVGAGWLRAYEAAAEAWPDAAFFGGPIVPCFAGTPPPWLLAGMPLIGGAFAANAGGADGEIVAAGHLPFGANLAIRLSHQRRALFDLRLGRGPVGWVRSGDEIDVLDRLIAAGAHGRWVAAATVEHRIETGRQTRRYVRDFFLGEGRRLGLADRRRSDLARHPAAMLRDLGGAAFAELKVGLARLFHAPERWAGRRVGAAYRAGRWIGRYAPDQPSAANRPVSSEPEMPGGTGRPSRANSVGTTSKEEVTP